jgi:hypothetical protein
VADWQPSPPYDCRITLRCLKTTFGFKLPLTADFRSLRSENSLIDRFFEQRQSDESGGEGGERVSQVTSRPAFKLTFARMRGATWFDRTHPPQGIVWLLGAEQHDDRHKGKSDAYDILGGLDQAGTLFPSELDLKRLELDRRRWDSGSFASDLRSDAAAFASDLINSGRCNTEVAGVRVRGVVEREDSMIGVYVGVSTRPVAGPRSGLMFPLTEERFLLIQEGVRHALEEEIGGTVLAGLWPDASKLPGGAVDERVFVVLCGAL